MALTDKLTQIADSIRVMTHSSSQMTLSEMPNKILGIRTGIEPGAETWVQVPAQVIAYLDGVSYSPADYTVSHISEYSPTVPVFANTKPVAKTILTDAGTLAVGGYTKTVNAGSNSVNSIPNVYTPYSLFDSTGHIKQTGTLKPTGFLRWINTPSATNVRDLGGWSCDGGTVKYGKLFRGGEVSASDIDVLVNQCGVRHELNLRGSAEALQTKSALGISYTCPQNYVWYSLADKDTWAEILHCVFNSVVADIPLYFHCSAGADRAGTVACILEALLGISQNDIDKDYELTCFSIGNTRLRNGSDWSGLIGSINAHAGTTFRDKAATFVASLGITYDEINAYRHAMINGNPVDLIPSIIKAPITWKDGYTCAHAVGGSDVVSVASGYITTELIDVEYGKTYTLKLNSSESSSLRWVGINNGSIVEETNVNYTSGENTLTWSPQAGTSKLRIRGYHSSATAFTAVTGLEIT